MNCALVIPYFNEQERFQAQAFEQALIDYPGLALIFVDDGSLDNSHEIIERFHQAHPGRTHHIAMDKNRGKAEAVRKGMSFAYQHLSHSLIGFWDMDLAAPLSELAHFFEAFEKRPHTQAILGSRILKLGNSIERSLVRHYLGRIFATLASVCLQLPVYDTQCGAKVIRRGVTPVVTATPFVSRWFFDVEVLFRLKKGHTDSPPHQLFYELALTRWIAKPGSRVRLRDFFLAPFHMLRIAWRYR
jgi:dolichyl-phosphate beta-glucosyltransferase